MASTPRFIEDDTWPPYEAYPPYPDHPMGYDPSLDALIAPPRPFWRKERKKFHRDFYRSEAEMFAGPTYWARRAAELRPLLESGEVTMYDFRYRFGYQVVKNYPAMRALHDEFADRI